MQSDEYTLFMLDCSRLLSDIVTGFGSAALGGRLPENKIARTVCGQRAKPENKHLSAHTRPRIRNSVQMDRGHFVLGAGPNRKDNSFF